MKKTQDNKEILVETRRLYLVKKRTAFGKEYSSFRLEVVKENEKAKNSTDRHKD